MNSLYTNSGSFRQFPKVVSQWWRLVLLLSFLLPCLFLFPEAAWAQTEDSEEDQPIIVTVYLGIIDIPQVDELMETFDLIAYMNLYWNDPKVYESIRGSNGLERLGEMKNEEGK